MLSADLLIDAQRQLTICNACRYCEEYCAVFPALELRKSFDGDDVIYLANLCHDCHECFYACQYAPPHEFALNLPQVLAEARRETYQAYSWPSVFRWIGRLGTKGTVGLAVGLGALFILIAGLVGGFGGLGHGHTGPGAFYAVIPWLVMLIPALALAVFVVVALAVGAVRFIVRNRPGARDLLPTRAALGALMDAMSLRYLRGAGNEGCAYPQDTPSLARVVYHSMVAYGFLADFGSTIAAAIWQDFLGTKPPYPILSVPVMLGIVGGAAIIVGVIGLLALRARSDTEPAASSMTRLDRAFLVLLGLVSVTGLLLTALRGTPALSVLLDVHLGTVAALFLTMPYGKFAHGIYRYAALVRYRLETARATAAETPAEGVMP
ncbi:MAG TPA: tricarballylate utilization 4Fe-4S protein TcuB [Trebonia sp.]|nr:tricarballylate utilization 4Fe-4S protein TcuB [Trebonia sp.]